MSIFENSERWKLGDPSNSNVCSLKLLELDDSPFMSRVEISLAHIVAL